MTLREAVETGKKYRRYGWHNWYGGIEQKAWRTLNEADALADDWEIQPEPRSPRYWTVYETADGQILSHAILDRERFRNPNIQYSTIRVREVLD